MEILVQRKPATDGAILSDIFVNGARECFGLEGEGVQIPAGRYRVTITASAHFGRMLPLINDVPGRSGVRIHSGNSELDTEGCLLVGQRATVDSVRDSRLAMAVLQPKIAGALARHEDVWIVIRDPRLAPPELNA